MTRAANEVTRAEAEAQVNAAMTEKSLSQQIVDYARSRGWLVYRTFNSQRSPAGFPDLVLVRAGVCLFVECKREGGKLTDEQMTWLAALGSVEMVRVDVWRPSSRDRAWRVLE